MLLRIHLGMARLLGFGRLRPSTISFTLKLERIDTGRGYGSMSHGVVILLHILQYIPTLLHFSIIHQNKILFSSAKLRYRQLPSQLQLSGQVVNLPVHRHCPRF